MEDEGRKISNQMLISLPREQKPLPKIAGIRRYENFIDLVVEGFSRNGVLPSHAWVRTILSVGHPASDFVKAYKRLLEIKSGFGKAIVISAGLLDHHHVETGEFEHMCDPETGNHEIEIHWINRRTHGGSHFLIAVDSSEADNSSNSESIEILDAIETLLRMCLGNSAVVHTRNTMHIRLGEKSHCCFSSEMKHYGDLQIAKSDAESVGSVLDLLVNSEAISVQDSRRLSLGLRWAGTAFKESDLLSHWTALEVLSGKRGSAIYPVIAKAFGLHPREGQKLAKRIFLDEFYDLRGDYVHGGCKIHLSVLGNSFLLALSHDLARFLANLDPKNNAINVLGNSKMSDLANRIEI